MQSNVANTENPCLLRCNSTLNGITNFHYCLRMRRWSSHSCSHLLVSMLQTEIHWYGWFAMTFYICAFIFYMYVRIAHSLDLGRGYIWYGIYLLCVEVLGFTTTIIYGLNLLWNPVIEQFPEDPDSPGKPKVRSKFE